MWKVLKIISPPCKRMLLVLIVLCVLSIINVFLYFKYNTKELQILADENIVDFLVDTPACKIPSYNPWDRSVVVLYKKVDPYKCKGIPSFLQIKPNAVVSLDDTILRLYYELTPKDVFCTYEEILRAGKIEDFTRDELFSFGPSKPLSFDVPLKEDFIRTTCIVNGTSIHNGRQFRRSLPLTPLKPDVEKRCNDASDKTKGKSKLPNIAFVGIDSVSRLNFLRHFPKTISYLKKLSPFSLNGYNKVSDNTFPNLVPMLTGHPYQYYWNDTYNKTMYFDDLDYLWKRFAKVGYRTLFAEDAPTIALFNYYRSGFKKPPTDYYFRPFALAVEDSEDRFEPCLWNKLEMTAIHDYLKSFIKTMDTRPFFAFVFVARLTHGILNNAGYADEPSYYLLRDFHESGVLNNTILIFFSDHGLRFGDIVRTQIGQLEERKPFMQIMLPTWFAKKYPKIARNLEINERRLTSPYDIHETMLDLLNLDHRQFPDEPVLQSPGISLFNEVSSHRTCSHAAITPHWCTCQIQKHVPVGDSNVVKAATALVETINRWTLSLRSKCALLTLTKIEDARLYDQANKFASSEYNEFLVVISVAPSGALLEATVRCETKTNQCKVVDDVSRINSYGSQSNCIDDTVLKKFCYCT